MLSKLNSFDSILNFLREPTSSSSSTIVDSTIPTGSDIIINDSKSSKKQSKEKNLINVVSTTPPPQLGDNIEISSKGRVRYGPITVNPRKQASKTLFTGRRSKYEVLSTDEEEKRRDRRDRNRVAATKCREKRENVLVDLENEESTELDNNKRLFKLVNDLQQRKNNLESILTNHLNECPLMNNSLSILQPSMIFGDAAFLSSITDTPPLPLPSYQQPMSYEEEEELSHILDPTPLLTNSAYNTGESNSILMPQPLPMTNSSIDRLFNALQSPTISMESTTNSILFNSAFGSSCAKQHSSSSEDDSLPPKRTNPYVY